MSSTMLKAFTSRRYLKKTDIIRDHFKMDGLNGFTNDFKQLMLSLFQDVDRLVDHNPFQPGPKARVSAIAVQVPERTDKCFLQSILSVFFAACNAIAYIVHRPRVKAIYLVMGLSTPRLTLQN